MIGRCCLASLDESNLCRLLLGDPKADEDGDSEGMGAVGGDQRRGWGVGGELCSRGGEEVWDEMEVVVVAEAVGGYVADGGVLDVGWQRRAGEEEEFVGTGGGFDAGPGVVAGAEADEGFDEVAV